jgi:hypothetical protein
MSNRSDFHVKRGSEAGRGEIKTDRLPSGLTILSEKNMLIVLSGMTSVEPEAGNEESINGAVLSSGPPGGGRTSAQLITMRIENITE